MEYVLSTYYITASEVTRRWASHAVGLEEKLTVVPCGVMGAKARTEDTNLSQNILADMPRV